MKAFENKAAEAAGEEVPESSDEEMPQQKKEKPPASRGLEPPASRDLAPPVAKTEACWSEMKAAPELAKKAKDEIAKIIGRKKLEIATMVALTEPVDFKPAKHGGPTKADFAHPEGAEKELLDVAELMSIYNDAKMLIEGHTATPDNKLDSWAFKLAEERAEKVKAALVAHGVSADRLSTVGRPGHHGNGHSDIVFKILCFSGPAPAAGENKQITLTELPQAPSLDKKKGAQLKALMDKGRVKVDNHVDLREPIDFHAVHHGQDPTPKFHDAGKAKQALGDVAAVLKVYDTAHVVVEGHTATPDDKMDAWAQSLADVRAEIVKATIVSHGIDASRLASVGLPGNKGSKRHDVLIKFTHF